jgi:transcriptional regulator with GAF, ATPase, and Fis domain
LTESLLESELFGHEKGAFTGADQLRKGRFELADGGTLMLDEISEISPQLQAKLLRVLQEGQFERVGSSVSMDVDVRIIATTNRDLARSVAAGEFRQDLYYRLNVLPIHLPPLRDRPTDIPLLAEFFLQKVALREGRDPKKLDAESIAVMQQYSWPGNVRELQNICERASVLSRRQVIEAGLIQPWLTEPEPLSLGAALPASPSFAPVAAPAPAPSTPGVKPLDEVEREQIVRTLGHFGGNRARTAEALGIGVRTLGLKLKKWKEQNLVAQTL